MKITGIAVYSLVNYKKIKAAQKASIGLFSNDAFKTFEENQFPTLIKDLDKYEREGYRNNNEFIYIKRDLESEYLYVILSERELMSDNNDDMKSFYRLFNNIQHVHIRGEKLQITLKDIVDNPLNYIGKDLLVQRIGEDLHDLKVNQLFKLKDQLAEREEKLTTLNLKSDALKLTSDEFADRSKKMNKCCSWTS